MIATANSWEIVIICPRLTYALEPVPVEVVIGEV